MIINRAFKPLFTEESRYKVIYGGAGSGKSYSITQKIVIDVLQGKSWLIARKVARTLRHSVFKLFRKVIADENLEDEFVINKSDMSITCRNGAEIILFGLDDVEKLKSIAGIESIWIEEASETTQNDFEQLDLRLRGESKYKKEIILSFNPIDENHWLKKYFFDNGYKLNPKPFILKTTYLDNRFIDEAYKRILESLKETNPDKYRIYALGEWGSLKNLIYPAYKIVKELPKEFNEQRWGQDFGFNNPSATVLIRKVGERDLFIDEILYQTHLTNSELITSIKATAPELMRVKGYLDSAEPDRIKEFAQAGFWVSKANKSVKFGITSVQSYNLHVTERSTNIIAELQGYVWQERDGKPIEEPVKIDDHAMDALRYAVVGDSGATNVKSTILRGI